MCVEPDDSNRSFSSMFTTQNYADISLASREPKFDIICLFHVFEHIRNPHEFLTIASMLLKQSGFIIIEVPYIEDPLITIYENEKFKDFYFQPMHPFIYSLQSLRYVFEKNGYREKEIIFHQRYGLDNHLTWLCKGRPGGDAYLNSLFGDNKAYKESLVRVRKTDTVFYIAQPEEEIIEKNARS